MAEHSVEKARTELLDEPGNQAELIPTRLTVRKFAAAERSCAVDESDFLQELERWKQEFAKRLVSTEAIGKLTTGHWKSSTTSAITT